MYLTDERHRQPGWIGGRMQELFLGEPLPVQQRSKTMLEKKVNNSTVRLVKDDITDMEVEAFVFDITPDVQLGSGYGGAIAQRGGKVVQKELDVIGGCATGEGIITSAGKMKAKHIIHVNGPKYLESDTEGKLARATGSALKIADKEGITDIALPPIGTGLYQVPLDVCARVMVKTVADYLKGTTSLNTVTFVGLDSRELEPLKTAIEGGI